jgi:hypothetical protein
MWCRIRSIAPQPTPLLNRLQAARLSSAQGAAVSADYIATVRERVPRQLLQLPVWLTYRLHAAAPGEKAKKVPYYADGSPRQGKLDSAEDRARLVDFETAASAMNGHSGLGIALGEVPGEELHLCGVDLDNLGPQPERDPRVLEILAVAESYCEKSPSGTGLHILGTGNVGTTKRDARGLEVYSGGRFFTVTGDAVNSAGLADLSHAAKRARELFGVEAKAASGAGTASGHAGVHQGGRNSSLSGEAYRLRKLGWSVDQILMVLRAMNEARCVPPLPDVEVVQIVGGKAGVTTDADADPWTDEPLNLFAKFAARPLVAAELPPEIAEYPALYAEQTGFDPTLTLSSALAVMAAAIPDQIQLCANSATRHFASARLWVMSLGRPGAAKSPAQKAMREPLDRLNVELYESWKAEAAACEKEKTPPPPQPTAVVNNVTIEAMSEALVNNERGVLYANDEAMSWLGSMDQYRSGGMDGDRAEWLRMFDGGHHVVHRIRRGTVFVKNWGASVLTATTPAALEKVARHLPEDGLLQRVMVFHVRSRQVACTDSGRGEIEAARDRYTATIHRLWGLMPKAHNGVVPLSPEARSLFTAWEADLIQRQEALGALSTALESHIAKYSTFALRLALTFHCAQVVNMADTRARDPAAYPITAATFGQVFRFLHRVQQHAFALYLGLGKSASYELARDIARTILARHTTSGTVQRRELMQTTMSFRKADRSAQDDALQLLVDAGWLRPDTSGYPKAGARYTVNPHLASRFATLAVEERERRAIAREAIAEAAQDRRAELGEDADAA